jgi:hypothetical protein
MKEIPNLNAGRLTRVQRAGRWLFSRRILRRMLIGGAGLLTMFAIVYTRVNVHGYSEWARCQREMAARGEMWNWTTYAPAPVPDEQNIFKAPQMAEWFGDDRGLGSRPLEQPITNDFARQFANPDSTAEISTAAAATHYVAWSAQFQSEFDTINEALKRPYARIVADYSQPYSITLPNVASLRAVVETLTQSAKCHLILGQTDQAWQELTLLSNLRRLVESQGNFITPEGDWMRRGIISHCLQVIAEGTTLHAWRDTQLLALEEELRESDCIAFHVEALKCGEMLLASSMVQGDLIGAALTSGGGNFGTRLKNHLLWLFIKLAPRGMRYEKATGTVERFRIFTAALTPADGIIHPREASQAFFNWKRAQQGLPSLLRTQTLVNEGRIACALERYRSRYGNYPETLGVLVPECTGELPRDLVNGQSLHYRRTNDGSFLLYSVGWNETDDGGKIAMAGANQIKATEGDWVWMNRRD